MFANRFAALTDACVLAGALKRNLLLTLAEAEFFRVRWSGPILAETERAISRILADKLTLKEAEAAAGRAVAAMAQAFKEAAIENFEPMPPGCAGLPDPKDANVLAAALKTRATVIVTDNLKDFPQSILGPLNLEARSADAFIADTIDLDPGRGSFQLDLWCL